MNPEGERRPPSLKRPEAMLAAGMLAAAVLAAGVLAGGVQAAIDGSSGPNVATDSSQAAAGGSSHAATDGPHAAAAGSPHALKNLANGTMTSAAEGPPTAANPDGAAETSLTLEAAIAIAFAENRSLLAARMKHLIAE